MTDSATLSPSQKMVKSTLRSSGALTPPPPPPAPPRPRRSATAASRSPTSSLSSRGSHKTPSTAQFEQPEPVNAGGLPPLHSIWSVSSVLVRCLVFICSLSMENGFILHVAQLLDVAARVCLLSAVPRITKHFVLVGMCFACLSCCTTNVWYPYPSFRALWKVHEAKRCSPCFGQGPMQVSGSQALPMLNPDC